MYRLAILAMSTALLLGISSLGNADEKTSSKSAGTTKEKAASTASQAKAGAKKTEKKESAKSSSESSGGRLPRFFASLVDDAQREKIYATQEKYRDKIAALRKQIEELEAEQLAECESVLTSAQKKELDTLRKAGSKEDKPETPKATAKKKAG